MCKVINFPNKISFQQERINETIDETLIFTVLNLFLNEVLSMLRRVLRHDNKIITFIFYLFLKMIFINDFSEAINEVFGKQNRKIKRYRNDTGE